MPLSTDGQAIFDELVTNPVRYTFRRIRVLWKHQDDPVVERARRQYGRRQVVMIAVLVLVIPVALVAQYFTGL